MAPASSSGKSGYHHGSLSQALVREGFSMVEQSGADAMTLTALAKKLGVTHAAVYRHFTDRAAFDAHRPDGPLGVDPCPATVAEAIGGRRR